ncbi:MAG: DUF1467 family protein [SAR202 cluster bacterium]|nr:DUF1467 family protein [SAR202 cluster bacterium]
MTWFTGVAAFVVIWFLVLFGVLPWGIRQPDQPETGHEPGAPERPRLVLKVGISTGIAVVVWGVLYAVIRSGVVDFRE